MVTYQRWTSVCYEVARQKGATLEGPGTQEENRTLISVIAEIWNERKQELETATLAEARTVARQEITVSDGG